ncbi:Mo-dependent nitrogenase C-terminal domain-containing protein [Pleurocapsa sp. PCC 7319]|uniref:Mo-dependent nitrogenase C-terminal domain-containing protein n=1 Tax=Pleurocapsa sp. PCC 7319 TaxID=118161 RepID=UPI0003487D35|nr:Mo-dependent nitrogenase C-terminal domain-containing protein [Pleurocapsa sp. PCC 7319]
MNVVHHKFESLHLSGWINQIQHRISFLTRGRIDPLSPLRKWLNNIEINDSTVAHRICKLIPSQCPFEREIKVLGRTVLRIPPMCKLNPLYDEVIALRFRAICYLADVCGEDVSVYC